MPVSLSRLPGSSHVATYRQLGGFAAIDLVGLGATEGAVGDHGS